jgi:geranylgeranyl diphosphate synthase type II
VGRRDWLGVKWLTWNRKGAPNIQEETLNFIHTHKTGALLEACVVCGGILAGATDADQERLSRYAQNIGLAFQIVDDILDITATQEELGKTAGKDLSTKGDLSKPLGT